MAGGMLGRGAGVGAASVGGAGAGDGTSAGGAGGGDGGAARRGGGLPVRVISAWKGGGVADCGASGRKDEDGVVSADKHIALSFMCCELK